MKPNFNAGYKSGAKMMREMMGTAPKTAPKPVRVSVKPRTGGPRMAENTLPVGAPAEMPKAPQFKKGGKVKVKAYERAYAKGGAVKKIAIKPENKGNLHKALDVPAEEKIPAAKIAKAEKSSNPALKKQAVFAANAAKWNKKADGGAVKGISAANTKKGKR